MGEDYLHSPGEIVHSIADGKIVEVFEWPLCDEYEVVDGKKKKVKNSHGWGGVVIIEHNIEEIEEKYFDSSEAFITSPTEENPQKVYSLYGHLNNIEVVKGDVISKYDKIGEIAKMCIYDPHLHLEIKDVEALETDILWGVGGGYSGIDNHAPHRYIPSKFIEKNKDLIIKEEILPPQLAQTSSQKKSLFQKFTSYLTNLFTFGKTQEVVLSNKIEEDDTDDADIYADDVDNADDVVSEKETYNAEIISKTISKQVLPGQEISIIIVAKNTGNATWQQKDFSLNVVGGQAKNATFKHSSWMTSLRPTKLAEQTVQPDANGTFSFTLTSPDTIGNHQLQLMIVRQSGTNFTWTGNDVATIAIDVQKEIIEKPVEQDETVTNLPSTKTISKNIFDNITKTIKGIKDNGIDAFDTLVKNITSVFGGGSSTSQQEESNQTPTPEISIVYPTSTPFITGATSNIIIGTYNADVGHVWVNDESSDNLIFDNEQNLWYFVADVDTTTTTFSFVGYDTTFAHETEPIEITIIREVEEIIIPEFTITFPSSTSTTWITTSSLFTFAGIYTTSTDEIWVNSTSTDALILATSTWSFDVELIETTTTFSFTAWNEDKTASTTIEIEIMFEEPEIELPAPIITYPTSTIITTSTFFEINGTKDETITDVFLYESSNTSNVYTATSTTSTWWVSVELSEGENTFVVYGQTDEHISPTTTVSIIRDTTGSEIISLTTTSTQDSLTLVYDATDMYSEVNMYEVQLDIGLYEGYISSECSTEEWYETSDMSILSSISNFVSLNMQQPCIRIVTSTTAHTVSFMLDPELESLAFDVRVRAYDALSNVGAWYDIATTWGNLSEEYATEGYVILSEIAWMGTTASANDEWFELCNMDEMIVDLSDWRITWEENDVNVPFGAVLSSGDCVVFERTDQTTIDDYDISIIYTGALGNDGEHLTVYSSLGNIMDEVDASAGWDAFGGDNETKDTMIRIDPFLSDTGANNWCTFSDCPEASMRGDRFGTDADGNDILGSPGDWEQIFASI